MTAKELRIGQSFNYNGNRLERVKPRFQLPRNPMPFEARADSVLAVDPRTHELYAIHPDNSVTA